MVIYSSAFNLLKNSYDYLEPIDNFCSFADKVFIAVNKSEDDTLIELVKLTSKYKNLSIIPTDILYDDPLIDGKVKNAALQFAEENSESEYFIGCDLDETLPLEHKDRWRYLAQLFLDYYKWDAILAPSIDLWGSKETVRWEVGNNRKYKFYLHRRGLMRGPVHWGLTSQGYLDLSKSDGCDLIKKDSKELAYAPRIDGHLDNITDCAEYYSKIHDELIYVVHHGNEDLERKAFRNKQFWFKNWNNSSGRTDVVVETKLEDYPQYNLGNHGLNL